METPISAPEPVEINSSQSPTRIRRPRSVTILALGVLMFTVINLARLILSIKVWDFLSTWPGVSPWYVMLTGLIWALAGIPLLWGLWSAKPWAPTLLQAEALTYSLYFWLDRVFLVDHPVSGAQGAEQALLPVNWKFAASATIVSLAFIAWTLNREKVKAYFNVAQVSKEPGTKNNDDNG